MGSLAARVFPAIAAMLAALGALSVLVLAIGESPATALAVLFRGAFGDAEGLGYTLFYATDYVFAGLAVALPYQAGQFNIGGEGQALLGGLGAALVALSFGNAPGLLLLPLTVLAAVAFAAGWAFIPAWLLTRRGSHLVITTIMFNFIAAALIAWLLVEVLIAPGQSAPETPVFAPAAWLGTIGGLGPRLGIDAGAAPLNVSALIALLAAISYGVLLRRTPLGYEIRAAGLGPAAAAAAGIPVARVTMIAICAGGACAGLIAVNELLGAQHRLTLDYTAGAGFVGIAVALIGRGTAPGIVLAAVLFGALNQGGAALAFDMPAVSRDAILAAEGVVILVCAAFEGGLGFRVARPRRRLAARSAASGNAGP